MEDIYYNGYRIMRVFAYADGKADYQYYAPDAEYGELAASCTLEELKQKIDEEAIERKEQSHFDSGFKCGYRDAINDVLLFIKNYNPSIDALVNQINALKYANAQTKI